MLRDCLFTVVAAFVLTATPVFAQSSRLETAKNAIGAEQWGRAIGELRVALQDRPGRARDEVHFWLAHSLHQAGQSEEALTIIETLTREAPRSRWVKPAHSLRIEIASELGLEEVLWKAAAPHTLPVPRLSRHAHADRVAGRRQHPRQPRESMPFRGMTPPRHTGLELADALPDLRIEALSALLPVRPERAVRLLSQIAATAGDPDDARRAIFVLGQSGRPEAGITLVRLASDDRPGVHGPAIRQLGLFGGAGAAQALVRIHATGAPDVRMQALAAMSSMPRKDVLLRAVRGEKDRDVRAFGIRQLGLLRARSELMTLYRVSPANCKPEINDALLSAGGVWELSRIAREDPDASIRTDARNKVRLIQTLPPE